MRYRIYCDESEKTGVNYSDFFGGILLLEKDLNKIEEEIAAFRNRVNYFGELKWSKIDPSKLTIYQEFVEVIFEIIKKYNLKVRIFFRHNSKRPTKQLTENHKQKRYFFLYHQFLKHHFGLQFISKDIKGIKIYADDLPDKRGDNVAEFKRWICKAFNDQGVIIKDEDISEAISAKHNILQVVDVLLGSIQFKLNDKDLKRDESGKIAKKTKAKIEIYKKISSKIRSLEPQERYKHFNIGVSTARNSEREIYDLVWRHWSFIPK